MRRAATRARMKHLFPAARARFILIGDFNGGPPFLSSPASTFAGPSLRLHRSNRHLAPTRYTDIQSSHEHPGEKPTDQIRAWHLNRRSGVGPIGPRQGINPQVRVGSTIMGPSIGPSCILLHGASMRTTFDGPCKVHTATRQAQEGMGIAGTSSPAQSPADNRRHRRPPSGLPHRHSSDV